MILVARESAIQQGSRDPPDVFPIDRDHSNIVKFTEDDIHYAVVKDYLQTAMDESKKHAQTAESERLLNLGHERDPTAMPGVEKSRAISTDGELAPVMKDRYANRI